MKKREIFERMQKNNLISISKKIIATKITTIKKNAEIKYKKHSINHYYSFTKASYKDR
jgi:hypothetical protein